MKTQNRAQIVLPTTENIARVAAALRNDEVIGMPTETVYGLAGNCWSPAALARIFETKERPTFDPLIVHIVGDLQEQGVVDFTKLSARQKTQIEKLIHRFWPGPLTLVLPKDPSIPDLATSGFPTVAVRMPSHPVAQALIKAAGTPLAAPSANRFGRISPTTAEAVFQELGDRIGWILDGGPSQIGLESTIVGFNAETADGELRVLRPGGTPLEALEDTIGSKIIKIASHSSLSPQAPGMLKSHYSPRTPLYLLPNSLSQLGPQEWDWVTRIATSRVNSSQSVGLLLLQGNATEGAQTFKCTTQIPAQALSLSETGDFEESAKNLFAAMRQLDELQAPVIFAEPCKEPLGLGFAITDRLQRASSEP